MRDRDVEDNDEDLPQHIELGEDVDIIVTTQDLIRTLEARGFDVKLKAKKGK